MSSTFKQLIASLDPHVTGAFYYLYEELLKGQDLWWQKMVLEDTTPDEYYYTRWLKDIFSLNEGVRKEPPVYRQVQGESHSIRLRRWDQAIRVDSFDWTGSQKRLGQIQQLVGQIALLAARQPQNIICDIFNLGNTSAYLAWDGQNVYADAHPKGGTTFDNLLAGTFDAAGTAFQTVRTAMMRFPSDEGSTQPLGIAPTHIWVPPDLEVLARQLVASSFVPGGSGEGENPYKGIAEVVSDARITDTNDWGVFYNGASVKPFILVRHDQYGQPNLIAETDMTSPEYKNAEDFVWWFRFYMAVTITKPEFHIKVVNA